MYDSTAPSAYLNYLVFDEHFKLVAGNSGVIQAGATPNQWNTMGTNGTVTVGQSGYLLVYASSMASRALYVDQTSLVFYSGAVLEENHYYPFGLTLTTSTTSPAEKNNYKLTTKELQPELGLNTYDFGARMQDMQIGRWMSTDPLAEQSRRWSPYTYCMNNPVRLIDRDGMSAGGPGGEEDEGWVEEAKEEARLYEDEQWNRAQNESRESEEEGRREAESGNVVSPEEFAQRFPAEGQRAGASEDDPFTREVNSTSPPARSGHVIPGGLVFTAGMTGDATVPPEMQNEAIGKAEAESEPGRSEEPAVSHPYEYAPRVRARGVQDPSSHNFPYSFDDEILSTPPIPKANGYKMFQLRGPMNGRDGVFEIGLTDDEIINHRFFRPDK